LRTLGLSILNYFDASVSGSSIDYLDNLIIIKL